MQAVAVRAFRATPEVMELPRPKPAADEILVRIAAAGLNPFDWKIIDGTLEGKGPHVFPMVLGVDGAGTIEELGERVQGFHEGDAVFGSFLHPPFGRGTFAQWAPASAHGAIVRVPRGLTPETAAALPTAGMTALSSLDDLRVGSGRTVLVVGAAGGVGSFAVQLAATRGARVLAATRRDQFDYVRGLGAHETIALNDGPVGAMVRAAHPAGLDALLDMTSPPDRFQEIASAVRAGGSAASTIGSASVPDLARAHIKGTNIDMHPTPALLERLAEEAVNGRLQVRIESTARLAEVPEAIARSRAGTSRGKTIVVP